jgi:hypothetical protein
MSNTAFINFSLVLRRLKLITDGAKDQSSDVDENQGRPPFRRALGLLDY